MKKYKLTKKQKKMRSRVIISVLALIIAWLVTDVLFPGMPWWGSFLIFLVPYVIVGYDVLKTAFVNLIHGQVFDEKFLMMVATVGAFATGEFPEATFVMLFYQVGELFQSIAVGRSRKSISSLMDIRPDYANVVRDGEESTVSPDEVSLGEIIVIKPGEKIPLDGEIIEGNTSVNTAALTGESLPSDKTVGDKVISGTLNLSGVIKVRTESEFSQSTVAKILELVENSSEKKAKAENFITKFSRYYTPIVVISAVLLAVIPPVILGISSGAIWKEWVMRALSFLVVSCPCALVVSVPLSFFGGIGGASREGILIKGANYMEVLSKIDTVVFDKTGTLTKGVFAVEAVHVNEVSESELMRIAATAESYSTHPVAESIVRAYNKPINKEIVSTVEEIAGKGIKAVINGRVYYVGNGKLMDMVGSDWKDCHLSGTIIHVSQDKEYLGHIIINDEVKPDSKLAISNLKKLGVKKTVMLTGDKRSVADKVGNELGLDEIHSELLPANKVERVEALLDSGAKLAFVGDGINDAPVLTRADIGFAMGALGSDAAIESADVVLMDDKPSKIATAIKISRRTMTIVWENIIFALAIKVIILGLCALGIANMWFAVFGDVGVLILAILNAMRAMMKIEKN